MTKLTTPLFMLFMSIIITQLLLIYLGWRSDQKLRSLEFKFEMINNNQIALLSNSQYATSFLEGINKRMSDIEESGLEDKDAAKDRHTDIIKNIEL